MTITLSSELELALKERSQQSGVAPETLALNALKSVFLPAPDLEPRDDWERDLLSLGRDCGVSLSDEALSREGMYD